MNFASQRRPPSSHEPGSSGRNILVVDDDPIQLKIVAKYLVHAGYAVRTASTVAEALDLARSSPPDLVVSDVVMPDVDGFTLCQLFRHERRLARIPVVLLSAHFQGEADEKLALAVGAKAFAERTADFAHELTVVHDTFEAKDRVRISSLPPLPSDLRARHVADQLNRLLGRARTAEARYQTLLGNATDTVTVLSLDGIILEANERWRDFTGVAPDQLIGLSVREFAPAGQEEANAQHFARAVAKGSDQVILPLRRADGTTFQMEFSTNVVELQGEQVALCIGRDVTYRVQAAEALTTAEERYRSLLDRIPDVIWTIDQRGTLTFITANVEQVLGFRPDEMKADSVDVRLNQIHPEEVAAVEASFKALFKNGTPFDVEYRRLRKDGGWIWVRNRSFARYERDGVIYAEGMLSDISERRRLEEQLRHSQKMEAIGRLAGGVAHDFNNMLSVLLGYTVMLLEDIPSTHPMHEPLTEMKVAGERSADLTRQLLSFSRQQPQAKQNLNMNETIGGMQKFMRRLIGEDIDLATVFDPTLPNIDIDPGQLEQVVMNIVVNARDAMPEGGRLVIETCVTDCDDQYVTGHGEIKRGRYATVSISDSGSGMDSATQTRIFEPFFTTKELGKGTGLGLSIVFGIVHQYGGHVFVYSEPGKGTSFKVSFPVAGGTAVLSALPLRLATESSGSETILLVEDEDQVRNFVETVLRRHGYRVIAARHPGEAVVLCHQHGGPIDLLLTDVIMPHASGRQLADQLLAERPAMKVIYISGYTDNVVLDHGVPSEVAFLQKPVMPEALCRKVRAVLDTAANDGGDKAYVPSRAPVEYDGRGRQA
jgi:PAS domain S-box-containing protein